MYWLYSAVIPLMLGLGSVLVLVFPEEVNPSLRSLTARAVMLVMGVCFLSLTVWLLSRFRSYRVVLECPSCKDWLGGPQALQTGKCPKCDTPVISDYDQAS
jgi:hypothetical protein